MNDAGISALGQQWDVDGPHGVVRLTEEHRVQANQRKVMKVMYSAKPALWDGAPVEHLDPRRVQPTQNFIVRSNYEAVSKAPAAELPPVDVVRRAGKDYVVDGHHRWHLARQRGWALPARVVNYPSR